MTTNANQYQPPITNKDLAYAISKWTQEKSGIQYAISVTYKPSCSYSLDRVDHVFHEIFIALCQKLARPHWYMSKKYRHLMPFVVSATEDSALDEYHHHAIACIPECTNGKFLKYCGENKLSRLHDAVRTSLVEPAFAPQGFIDYFSKQRLATERMNYFGPPALKSNAVLPRSRNVAKCLSFAHPDRSGESIQQQGVLK